KAAIRAFRDHLETDFWSVVPANLTAGPAAWNEPVRLGVATAAFSKLVLRMAQESQISPSGLVSLQLLAALRQDLSDPAAKLDGVSPSGALQIGTCGTICPLSGKTLRADLSESAAEFLGSSANQSGLTVTDVEGYLARIAARTGDFWSLGGDPDF